ncbi:MAG: uracil-DNA glycosylase [Acidothermus cellulolyticus]|nr:uracil-DNA glycosylase [Acidothermus cellulolyticus]
MSPMSRTAAGDAWDHLAAQIRRCRRCAELAANRRHVVVGVRPAVAHPVVLVGEAPGAEEDRTGLPFVGRAGRLLDELLVEAGLPRATVAIVNVLKCRPPGNRVPNRVEIAACRPWLEAQLALLDPGVVVALGGTAVAWFFERPVTLAQVRGRVHEVRGWRVVPTYHPSAALRFGPTGAPRTALRQDLALAAAVAGHCRDTDAGPGAVPYDGDRGDEAEVGNGTLW